MYLKICIDKHRQHNAKKKWLMYDASLLLCECFKQSSFNQYLHFIDDQRRTKIVQNISATKKKSICDFSCPQKKNTSRSELQFTVINLFLSLFISKTNTQESKRYT